MTNHLHTPDLFDVSVEAYGPQGAYDIMATIRDSVDFTNDTLRLPAPIQRVGVGVISQKWQELPFKVRGVHTGQGGIEIQLNRKPANEIIPLIPVTILHEGAHELREQLVDETSEPDDEGKFQLFDYVIDDGLAVLTEAVILDEWAQTSCIKMTTKELKAGLTAVLQIGTVSHEEAYDFMEQNDYQGYRIGHYAVTAMAYRVPDLFRLFKLPYADYRTVAEELTQ